MNQNHVVLGGNGVAGRETVRALIRAGSSPISVGRRPSTIDGARSVVADLLVRSDVERALDGADVAYLVAGVPYSTQVWRRQWPSIVENAIEASLAHGVRLVFLDNVYAYGKVVGPMTESSPVRPAGRKGEVRAAVLAALERAASRGVDVTIGRSADFYGPGATTSVFNAFALDPIAQGKTATWLLDADQPHSLTYTPDIGEALAILGTDPAARGRVWHLPTAPALTGRQYIEIAAGRGAPVKVMHLGTLRFGAVFNTPARETLELAYQFQSPYVFDSSAFDDMFGPLATSSEEGIATALAAARQPAKAAKAAEG